MKSFRFRRKRPERKAVQERSAAFAAKDWISFVFSLFAAIVSAITAYFSFIVRTDELRVQAIDKPLIGFDKQIGQYRIDGPLSLIFINSGNQAVSVFRADVEVVENANPKHNAARCVGTHFDTDLEPFVLKGNEIVIKTIGLATRKFGQIVTNEHQESKFIVPQFGVSIDRKFTTCISIAGTSVMEQTVLGSLELYEAEFGAQNGGWMNYSFQYRERPKTIWHKVGTIFDR